MMKEQRDFIVNVNVGDYVVIDCQTRKVLSVIRENRLVLVIFQGGSLEAYSDHRLTIYRNEAQA